eukprot:gene6360-6593_t
MQQDLPVIPTGRNYSVSVMALLQSDATTVRVVLQLQSGLPNYVAWGLGEASLTSTSSWVKLDSGRIYVPSTAGDGGITAAQWKVFVLDVGHVCFDDAKFEGLFN